MLFKLCHWNQRYTKPMLRTWMFSWNQWYVTDHFHWTQNHLAVFIKTNIRKLNILIENTDIWLKNVHWNRYHTTKFFFFLVKTKGIQGWWFLFKHKHSMWWFSSEFLHCVVIKCYWHFRGMCCLHHQDALMSSMDTEMIME